MKKITLLTGTAALMAALSTPAFAQTEVAAGADATGITGINERIIDVEDAVQDDFNRDNDDARFGNPDRREGLFGSIALTYAGSTGNDENQDFSLAGRVSNNAGPWQQSVGMLIEFGEDEQGNKDKEEVSTIYDGAYYFNDRFYAFVLGRFSIDGLANGDEDYDGQPIDEIDEKLSDFARDGFIGVGPGYRVINTEQTAWRVQAGIGYRYTQTGAQKSGFDLVDTNDDGVLERVDVDDSSDSGLGYIVSSRLYHRFNDMVFITNDTDYLSSEDSDDVITNQFGVNFQMSDQLATRVSYTTEYQENREIRTDNTLGVSVVYGF
ncbi:YdiY family protein [Paracoccus angustae]|uniref:YdiY family protein n=1 Tax=Paracoccus angustae TaxID=1671480 RepID=A0ABV7TZ07_9RHOB